MCLHEFAFSVTPQASYQHNRSALPRNVPTNCGSRVLGENDIRDLRDWHGRHHLQRRRFPEHRLHRFQVLERLGEFRPPGSDEHEKTGRRRSCNPLRGRELSPGPEAITDAALRKYLRPSVSTYCHPVGTCKIGTDTMSVGDTQLKVHGIANLRVADASMTPSIVSGNTQRFVLAIAERAATLLSGEKSQRATRR